MSVQIKIELTPAAQKIVANLQTLPAQIMAAVAGAMDKANQLAIAKIQRDHLTGRGPYPPEQHKLGIVTNRLRGSVNASAAEVQGQQVVSAIGSNVVYAKIHEFGGRIKIQARNAKVRLKTDARGNLIRQLANANLAIFARKTHRRVRETNVTIPAYEVIMPERAPFRTGIEESLPTYKKFVSAGIVEAWNQMQN